MYVRLSVNHILKYLTPSLNNVLIISEIACSEKNLKIIFAIHIFALKRIEQIKFQEKLKSKKNEPLTINKQRWRRISMSKRDFPTLPRRRKHENYDQDRNIYK